jgi:hypothetical protein
VLAVVIFWFNEDLWLIWVVDLAPNKSEAKKKNPLATHRARTQSQINQSGQQAAGNWLTTFEINPFLI